MEILRREKEALENQVRNPNINPHSYTNNYTNTYNKSANNMYNRTKTYSSNQETINNRYVVFIKL